MKSFFAVVLGVVLVAAYHASTEAAPADDPKVPSAVTRSDPPPETGEGETTTVNSLVAAADGPEALLDPAFWDSVDLKVGLAPTADDNADDLLDARCAARILMGVPALRSLLLQQRYADHDVAEDARFLRPALARSRAFVRENLCVDSKAWAALGEDGRDAFLALLRRSAPYLRQLEVPGLDNPDGGVAIAAALNVLAGLQSLEKLELSDLNPSQAYAGELANVVFPNLQHLRISESPSAANSPKDFHTDLVKAAAPALSTLVLDFEPSTSEALQGAVESCQRLESVTVIYPGPFPALRKCTEIKELTVEFRNMKVEQVKKILEECRQLDKLEQLVLGVWGVEAPSREELNSAVELVKEFQQQRPQVQVAFGYIPY